MIKARWANRDQRHAITFAITAQLVSLERELAKLRKAYEVRDVD